MSKLFTPGPLSTSIDVKKAMLIDYGSRDQNFIDIIQSIRNTITKIACYQSNDIDNYNTILMQGSGTFGVESVLNSCIPKKNLNQEENNKLLVITNGSYGDRLYNISKKLNINVDLLKFVDNQEIVLEQVKNKINLDHKIKYVAMVHHETSTGQLNHLNEISIYLKSKGIIFIVDSMSAFGAVEIDVSELNIDFLISSANKCLEGVPGFSFVICNKKSLQNCIYSTSTCLDLYQQWINFEKNGQFRFTPPTHTILAFNQALIEYKNSGGLQQRIKRYKNNYELLKKGMIDLGFELYLPEELHGYFITSFLYPKSNFNFNNFYNYLKKNGFIIYPGKTTEVNTFRIGNIGQIFETDIFNLLNYIKIYNNNIKNE
jgi:2-aminoethylphosphonate-pyruvate transaminase